MAIHVAEETLRKIDKIYTHTSYFAGRTAGEIKFVGTGVVNMFSPVTVPMNNYKMTGANRYGDPQDMQNEVQTFVLTQDKSFSLVLDKRNQKQTNGTFGAGARLRQQVDEQAIPMQDKYVAAAWIRDAGHVVGMDKPTKSNILDAFSGAGVAMDNDLVPPENRYIAIGATLYGQLRLADQVIKLEGTGNKALKKGEMGECMGFTIIKVPDRYIPQNAFFLGWHQKSVENPHQIADTKIHQDPPGISGDLLEGRFLYDGFVHGKKCGGVYAAVASGSKQATPTIAISGSTATVTSSGATSIKATTDGSDPRYSKTAVTIQSGGTVTVKSGETVKAVAYGTFTSDVAEKNA